jgi:adenosine deaminase
MRLRDSAPTDDLLRKMPKAELHIHIEGSLEPEMMFEMAVRNRVTLRYSSVREVREAYDFSDLQSFLDLYYEGTRVLLYERDFYELTWAYLQRASSQGVRHAEIFFDPQAHTDRGVNLGTVITGLRRALEDGERRLGVSSHLILCFLRHLSARKAMETLHQALPYKQWIVGVGSTHRRSATHPKTSGRCSRKQEGSDSARLPTPGKKGHPSTSGRPWTIWGRPGSTTASGAWRIPGWYRGSGRSRYR